MSKILHSQDPRRLASSQRDMAHRISTLDARVARLEEALPLAQQFLAQEEQWANDLTAERDGLRAALMQIANATGAPKRRAEECQRIAREIVGWEPF